MRITGLQTQTIIWLPEENRYFSTITGKMYYRFSDALKGEFMTKRTGYPALDWYDFPDRIKKGWQPPPVMGASDKYWLPYEGDQYSWFNNIPFKSFFDNEKDYRAIDHTTREFFEILTVSSPIWQKYYVYDLETGSYILVRRR